MHVRGDVRSLRPLKLNHVNAIVDGYDSAVAHFVGRLGLPRPLRATVRSVVFRARDLQAAEHHLASLGVPLAAGDDECSRLLVPESNHGLRFELAPDIGAST